MKELQYCRVPVGGWRFMSDSETSDGPSATVLAVIDQMSERLRADADIDRTAADRIIALLKEDSLPTPDQIEQAMFGAPEAGIA